MIRTETPSTSRSMVSPSRMSKRCWRIADTGAGSHQSGFDLILDEDDCLLCGGIPVSTVKLRGAFIGTFPVYALAVQVPALGFAKRVRAVPQFRLVVMQSSL